MIKRECIKKKQEDDKKLLDEVVRLRAKTGSRISDSMMQSMISFQSALSKGSKTSKSKSIYSAMGSKWGGTADDGDDYELAKLELKPSIQAQNAITHEWWQSINPKKDVYLPILEVKKLLVAKSLVLDLDSAGKQITKYHGKKDQIDYEEFYKMFCKGIFRIAL